MKTLCVIGTRPEAIKMAPVVHELRTRPGVANVVVATGQHREMVDDVLDLFQIRPDHDLDIMRVGQTPADIAAAVIHRLEPLLVREAPDWLLVQGDTTTTMAAALAGAYSSVKVAHVEAGLRTHDKAQPFPEEINRRVAGVVADVHFAPTRLAKLNLLREGVDERHVWLTGNPVIDALHAATRMPRPAALEGILTPMAAASHVILVTAHRRESFGAGIAGICAAVGQLVARHESVHVVYPVHPNPDVTGPVRRHLGRLARVHLIEPVDYCTMAHLMKETWLVLTDSGGLQEEAPSLGRPVLVLRSVTERPEAVEAGAVRLVGTDPSAIVEAVERLLASPEEYARMSKAVGPYGDGHAAERIVRILHGEPIVEFDREADVRPWPP